MKRGLMIILFSMIVASIAVSATVCEDDEWCEYQYDTDNTGNNDEANGPWSLNQGFGSSSEVGLGSDFQRLVLDIDNDGAREMLVSNSGTLIVYREEGGIFDFVDNIAQQDDQSGSMTVTDPDGDGIYLILIPEGAQMSTYVFDNETLTNLTVHTTSNTIQSGISCDDNSICYFTSKNSFMHNYNAVTDTIINTNLGSNYFGDTQHINKMAPVLTDENFDGFIDRVYFGCRNPANSNFEGVCKTIAALSLDASFAVGGFLQLPTAGSETGTTLTGMTAYDVNGDGLKEIALTYSTDGALNDQDGHVMLFENDGSACCGAVALCPLAVEICEANNVPTTHGCVSAGPVHVDTDGDGTDEVCSFFTNHDDNDAPGTKSYMSCYEPDVATDCGFSIQQLNIDSSKLSANSIVFIEQGNTGVKQTNYMTPVAANIDTDSADEIIVGDHIIMSIDDPTGNNEDYEDVTSIIDLSSINLDSAFHASVVDYNDDSIAEVVYGKDGITRIFFSTTQNLRPNITGVYGKNLVFPLCPGTNVTFNAQECFSSTDVNCNYVNDFGSDTERLVSSFGNGTVTESNIEQYAGEFSDQRPTLSHVFELEDDGTVVQIYLQDNKHTTDLTQWRRFTVSVQNLTAGQTCNIPCFADTCSARQDGQGSGDPISADITSSQQEQAVEDIVDIFTVGGNVFLKLFISGFILMVVIGFLVMQGIQVPFVYAISVIVTCFVLSLITLLPWIFTITVSVLMVFIGIIVAAFFGGGGNGSV